jgi:uncharacterized protein YkwD
MRGNGNGRFGRRIALVLVVALTIGLVGPGAASAATRDRDRWAMKKATNASRLNHDVRRVDLDALISDLARRHSAAMARRGNLFHTDDPARTYLQGRRWNYWGENVGMTPGSIDGLQDAFMASTSHRMNILNRSFRHVAIGTVRRDGVLWVTVFFWG